MAAASTIRPVRHETRALLRAHLAAASGYRHITRCCVVCHRLLRLAMELTDDTDPRAGDTPVIRGVTTPRAEGRDNTREEAREEAR
ncbi:DUF6274 family protein [Streptomyces sp. NPDC006368]|uniref:DUF6274 family protein n=1 Tax=Streptomyces sp. NPDC006368 TaxID=3156760 RepID=UPI0033A6F530